MIAKVSGILRRHVVPRPATDSTSTVPPIASILVRTTSMPTPRPETLVTAAAVENPGRKSSWSSSAWDIWSTSARVRRPLLDGLRGHRVGVDALAVVDHLDDHLAARVVGTQPEETLSRLAGRDPVGRRLDPVIDRVADQVRQRVLDRLEQAAVELGVAADHVEAHLPAARRSEVAHHPRHLGPHVLDGLHARLHDALLQLRGDQAEPLRGPCEVDVTVGGQPGDRVAGQHELADLAHQRVEQVEVHPDRGLGGRPARVLGVRARRLIGSAGSCGRGTSAIAGRVRPAPLGVAGCWTLRGARRRGRPSRTAAARRRRLAGRLRPGADLARALGGGTASRHLATRPGLDGLGSATARGLGSGSGRRSARRAPGRPAPPRALRPPRSRPRRPPLPLCSIRPSSSRTLSTIRSSTSVVG